MEFCKLELLDKSEYKYVKDAVTFLQNVLQLYRYLISR